MKSTNTKITFYVCMLVLFVTLSAAAITIVRNNDNKKIQQAITKANMLTANTIKKNMDIVVKNNKDWNYDYKNTNMSLEQQVNKAHLSKKMPENYSLQSFSAFDKRATGTMLVYNSNFSKDFCVDFNKTVKINFKAISAIDYSKVSRPGHRSWFLKSDVLNYLFLNNLKSDETFCMQNDKNEYVIARVFEPKFNEENLNVARYMQVLAANIVKQTNNL